MVIETDLPLRLPAENEKGMEFIEWLDTQVGNNRIARQRMVAFIQEWDHLRDELHERELREPTVEEYAARWGVAESSAYRLLDEFRAATEFEYPGSLCQLLWNGMPIWNGDGPAIQLKWLLGVEVVPTR
ncbi:MAG: hypothetical protein WKF96_13875 [Solirubrobacteraceae bacterium]